MQEDESRKQIGLRIKARREYLNMTQAAVAEKLGVEATSISNYERGVREVGAYDLGRIAAILTVPVSYFYNDEDIVGPANNYYYNGLSVSRKHTADEIIRALWLEDQRAETTHAKKAE